MNLPVINRQNVRNSTLSRSGLRAALKPSPRSIFATLATFSLALSCLELDVCAAPITKAKHKAIKAQDKSVGGPEAATASSAPVKGTPLSVVAPERIHNMMLPVPTITERLIRDIMVGKPPAAAPPSGTEAFSTEEVPNGSAAPSAAGAVTRAVEPAAPAGGAPASEGAGMAPDAVDRASALKPAVNQAAAVENVPVPPEPRPNEGAQMTAPANENNAVEPAAPAKEINPDTSKAPGPESPPTSTAPAGEAKPDEKSELPQPSGGLDQTTSQTGLSNEPSSDAPNRQIVLTAPAGTNPEESSSDFDSAGVGSVAPSPSSPVSESKPVEDNPLSGLHMTQLSADQDASAQSPGTQSPSTPNRPSPVLSTEISPPQPLPAQPSSVQPSTEMSPAQPPTAQPSSVQEASTEAPRERIQASDDLERATYAVKNNRGFGSSIISLPTIAAPPAAQNAPLEARPQSASAGEEVDLDSASTPQPVAPIAVPPTEAAIDAAPAQ